MAGYLIQGGRTLRGKITVHGAKNSVLPILAASLLNRSPEPIRLEGVPDLYDVRAMLSILANLGVQSTSQGSDIVLRTDQADCYHVPEFLMREMRSSIFLLGPLLGRFGKASVCYPGGCAIGKRPIDLHLSGLQALGAIIEEKDGYIHARGKLRGATITLAYPSVGATENLILAAVLARGVTIIQNAAREPEIEDLQNFLNKMGAAVEGAGSHTITIKGVHELGGTSYKVYPDRIAAGTYLIAAAITGGQVTLLDAYPEHLQSLLQLFVQAGLEPKIDGHSITLEGKPLKAVPEVVTGPFPGFPTDLQPPLMTMLALCHGVSRVVEKVFPERFHHVPQLNKIGARISLRGNTATIHGVRRLYGVTVRATDLRAGAALVLAGLAARGETYVSDIKHIERGYENIHLALNSLGARIERVAST